MYMYTSLEDNKMYGTQQNILPKGNNSLIMHINTCAEFAKYFS